MKQLYENHYKKKNTFSFGKNWKQFLKKLSPKKIQHAQQSLDNFLGLRSYSGKTFVDIGCGSGLFSLAAHRLGFKKVLSIDIDDYSIECANVLKKEYGNSTWTVKKMSALDKKLSNLGTFDVVYSWGVLHHTGSMYEAIENAMKLVKKNGYFYIAIYNTSKSITEGTSSFWLQIKKTYNKSPKIMKKIFFHIYKTYLITGMFLLGKKPFTYIKKYEHTSKRGMDFDTDVIDWLGGYPYEHATVKEIQKFFSKHGFKTIKTREVRSIGCNEFLFQKK